MVVVGIHESVSELFPPAVLADRLEAAADTSAESEEIPTNVVTDESDLADCDGLVTFAYDEAFLDAGLRWIHSIQAGVDRFPFDALADRDIRLTNSTGIHGDAVGETVVGYMTAFARRLHRHRDRERDADWQYPAWDEAFTLSGERLCVVGLGTLGRGIAARADMLGMDVVGVRRTPTPVDHVETVYTPAELHTAIDGARFVAVATPLTDATHGLIGADEFAAMADYAYLLNVSRGGVVDEDALLDALRADGLAGAALDVFETEPLPEASPFWDREDVIVTPHAAAATHEYADRVAALVVENSRRLATGGSLVNQVV
ncbi:MAG: D-2-hydroxyacid dehydrogenase [Haloarculaceae archaeon]